MDKVFFIVGLVLLMIFMVVRSIRYIHMFQLNSYMPKRLYTWFARNYKSEYGALSILHISLVIFLTLQWYYVFFAVTLIMCFAALHKFKNKKEKKKLVYTARVKRLLTTEIVFMGVGVFFIGAFALTANVLWASLLLAVFVLIGESKISYPVIANIINLPFEKLLQRYFYNDAKRILESNPDLIIIGITGSYGKTSSKYILSGLLSEKYNVLMTPGSYNTLLGVVRTIREQLKPTHEVFIVEMGAKNIGDIKEICDLVKPKYGLITSIGPQHLETFKNIDNIINTKFELVDSLKSDGKAFLNYDNVYIENKAINKKKVRFGVKSGKTDFWAENIDYGSRGATFDLCANSGIRINLSTQLLGMHNVLNIVGACSVAVELGVSQERIIRAVRRLTPVPHRLEMKRKSSEYIIIDDAYNSNPEGAREAFAVLNNFSGYNKILITPGLIELGVLEDKLNHNLGADAAKVFDKIILVGEKKTEPIFQGIKESGYDMENVYVRDNLFEALEKLNELNNQPTVVLLENDLPDDYEKIK